MKTVTHLLKRNFFLVSLLIASTLVVAINVNPILRFTGELFAPEDRVREEKKMPDKKIIAVQQNTVSYEATLTSDKDDYAPGSTATLTGSGFEPGETVTMQVLHANYHEGDPIGEDHEPWYVTADENGIFITTWHVCEDDCVGELLRATADGQTSGLHAEVLFTDASNTPRHVTPASGTILGGNTVSIEGTFSDKDGNLPGGGGPNTYTYTVKFGLAAAVPATWSNNSLLTNITVPAGAAGTIDVEVIATPISGSVLSSTLDNGYTYVCTNPSYVVFMETMGTLTSTTIAIHESNNRFDNDGYTMTGVGSSITNGIPSDDPTDQYFGASGESHVRLEKNKDPDESFEISGIVTTGLTNLQLSFGIFKDDATSNGSELIIEVSSDGINYT
jgi:hypothetical protein